MTNPAATEEQLLAAHALGRAVHELTRVERTFASSAPHARLLLDERIDALVSAIVAAKAAGHPDNGIRRFVEPARLLCGASPLIRYAQTWPRGHVCDYVLVEHLRSGKTLAPPETLGWHIEKHFLDSDLAAEWRARIDVQARVLENALADRRERRPLSVLMIAARAAPELLSIDPALVIPDDRFVLSDADGRALIVGADRVAAAGGRCEPVRGPALRQFDELRARGPYDLVLAGDAFDRAGDDVARGLADVIVNELCAIRGELCVVTLGAEPVCRCWHEVLVDWPVVERDEARLRILFDGVQATFAIHRDVTRRLLLTEVRRGH